MFANLLSMFKNAMEIYEALCRPVCREFAIQQTGLDILIYLAKNPGCNTAVDIQKSGGIKQSMVSFHVDKLVNDGYLERQAIQGDRRKVKLVCTEKAQPVIDAGLEVRRKYLEMVSVGISDEDRQAFAKIVDNVNQNLADCRDRLKKGEL